MLEKECSGSLLAGACFFFGLVPFFWFSSFLVQFFFWFGALFGSVLFWFGFLGLVLFGLVALVRSFLVC